MKTKNRPGPTSGMHREIYAIEHHYSCGGYWMAERIPDRCGPLAYKGEMVPNQGQFYLNLSGRMEVLSRYQVEMRIQCCRDRGEIVDFRYVTDLPAGSIVI